MATKPREPKQSLNLSSQSHAVPAQSQDRPRKRKNRDDADPEKQDHPRKRIPRKDADPESQSPAKSQKSHLSKEPAPRTSKHAPVQLSSRHQVSRKRNVILTASQKHHDPRFLPLADPNYAHGDAARKNYAFLDDYQADEMRQLAKAIKKSKDGSEREELRRELGRLQNRRKAKEAQEREREVQRRHRAEELEAVRAGKRPYFMKKGERRNLAVSQQLESMGAKQREKHAQRKRKKESAKEAKSRPAERRMANG